MKYALTNCHIYTGISLETSKAIVVDHNRIAELQDAAHIAGKLPCVDLGGRFVAPGFIDLQTNGGGGVLFNNHPTADGLARIVQAHRRFGSTSILPTIITARHSVMRSAARAIMASITAGTMPEILGIHFEGPFICEARAGVHSKEQIRPANLKDLGVITAHRPGKTLLTIAPESVSNEQICALVDAGVIVLLGHSEASSVQADAAFAAGATGVTHLFNAMSQMSAREPGLVGAALDSPDCFASLIVDGHHVSDASARIAVRSKAQGKTILITDAMAHVGSDLREFSLDGRRIRIRDGVCRTEDGVLAGSSLNMATAVRNAVHRLGLPVDEALRMASTYPARCLGLADDLGLIAPGYRANFVVFDGDLRVTGVAVDGQLERWG